MIALSDVNLYQSGGSHLRIAGLGGPSNGQQLPRNNQLVFSNVSAEQAKEGLTDYYCFYVVNDSATERLLDGVVYIKTPTPSDDSVCTLALGASTQNVSEQLIANANTAPQGVTFISGTYENPVYIKDILPKGFQSLWIKRVISANAKGIILDTITLTVSGNVIAIKTAVGEFTAAQLTGPTLNSPNQSSFYGEVSSEIDHGTLYWVLEKNVSLATTPTTPTANQVKNRQRATTGNTAEYNASGSKTLTERGTQRVALRPATQGYYFIHFLLDVGYGQTSNVVTSSQYFLGHRIN